MSARHCQPLIRRIIDEQMDMAFLQKKTTPLTPEEVQSRLDKILADGGTLAMPVKREKTPKTKTAKKTDATATTRAISASAAIASDADELDTIFPDADVTNS